MNNRREIFLRKVILILAFNLVISLSCLAQSRLGFQLKDGQKKAVIPFELHNNLIVVPVILNDALPLKFILDTGVRTAILTERTISDIINLPYSRSLSIRGVGGEKIVDAQIATNVTLELPGVRGKGHALFVLEEDYLKLRNYLGTEIHGILGYELLSRFIVKINFNRKKITIYDREYFNSPSKYEKLDITIENTKPYLVTPISINSNQSLNAKLMIDTGSSHTLMLLSNDNVNFEIPEKNVESSLGSGLGGLIYGKVARIHNIQFGEINIKEPVVTFPNRESYPDSLRFSYRNGTIGGGLLAQFNLIFDYQSNSLYIKKNKTYGKAPHYNLSGLTLIADGVHLDEFRIVEVRMESPAENAGLLVGDKILTVNGKTTEGMEFDSLLGFFNSKVDRLIRIEYSRDDRTYFTSFRLRKIL